MFLKSIFRLIRPLSGAKNAAVVVLAFYLAEATQNWGLLILGTVALSLIFSAVYAYNSVCDKSIDIKNSNKEQYSSAVHYFGHKKSLLIALIMAVLGIICGFYINIYFVAVQIMLVLVGFLYSSSHFRFKDKFILDVIFGATLTILLRFVAAWFIFKISFPPLLPMFALVFLKNGGFMLYKGHDRDFLIKSGVKNFITRLSQKTIFITSAVFFFLSIVSFVMLCLNSAYFHIDILGYLPIGFLFLTPFFIPPIILQYFLFFKRMKTGLNSFRTAGLIAMFLLIIIILMLKR